MTPRDAWSRWIASQLPSCSLDELRVIGVRLVRMVRARADYGVLNLATDDRDFILEIAEENVDRAFYRDALYVATHDPQIAAIEHEPILDSILDTNGGER